MKLFHGTGTALALGWAVVLASGCGKNVHDKRVATDALAGVPVSGELTLSPELFQKCDEPEALRVLDRDVPPVVTNADELWKSCQALFACSPTASSYLTQAFASGSTFRLGYADLKALTKSLVGDRIGGLYLGKSNQIYLDVSVKTPRLGCQLLLHEVVHRLDPAAYEGEESLRTEYRAYWQQTAFLDDLLKREGKLGDDARAHFPSSAPISSPGGAPEKDPKARPLPFHTRESLMQAVASLYGFKPDTSILKRYSKLPREQ